MKLTGFSEQFDGGRDVIVEQEGAHVLLSVEAGDTTGQVLLTPGQARAVAGALDSVAGDADDVHMDGLP